MTNRLIVGVGNELRQDDGIGPKVIAELQKYSLPNVILKNGGIDGFKLLDDIVEFVDSCHSRESGNAEVILIDAVDMGSVPGTIKLFTPSQAKLHINSDALSTHGFGLAEVLTLMEQLDIRPKLQIVGIQPQDISFGEVLSCCVAKQIPKVINLILSIL